MAITNGIIEFTGSVGNITGYKVKGVKGIIIRMKGGITRDQIKNSPRFKNTRLNNEEWKACGLAAKAIRIATQDLRHLCDPGFTGRLTALCKNIQQQDPVHAKGQRSVSFSTVGFFLEGFNMNTYNPFDNVLRSSYDIKTSRPDGSAEITTTSLFPDVNISNPQNQPCFRYVFTLGTLSDIIFDQDLRQYTPAIKLPANSSRAETPWYHWRIGSPALTLHLAIPGWQEQPGLNLILSAGIEFGVPVAPDQIELTKTAGCAKILRIL